MIEWRESTHTGDMNILYYVLVEQLKGILHSETVVCHVSGLT